MLSTIQTFLQGLINSALPWIVLAPWEAGIRLRLGKHVHVLRPGFNLRIPGIDRVSVQTTRLRVAAMPSQTLSTRDGKNVFIGCNIGYAIANIRKLYDSLYHAEDTIRAIAQQIISDIVFATDSKELQPSDLAMVASEQIRPRLERYGLTEISLSVTDFAVVRTYRLLSDQRWGSAGDYLTTNMSNGSGAPR